MANLTFTITPSDGSPTWTVVDDGSAQTQAAAAAYAAGKPSAHFTGSQKPQILARGMRSYVVNDLGAGGAGSHNFQAYARGATDRASNTLNANGGMAYNVSAGV